METIWAGRFPRYSAQPPIITDALPCLTVRKRHSRSNNFFGYLHTYTRPIVGNKVNDSSEIIRFSRCSRDQSCRILLHSKRFAPPPYEIWFCAVPANSLLWSSILIIKYLRLTFSNKLNKRVIIVRWLTLVLSWCLLFLRLVDL